MLFSLYFSVKNIVSNNTKEDTNVSALDICSNDIFVYNFLDKHSNASMLHGVNTAELLMYLP